MTAAEKAKAYALQKTGLSWDKLTDWSDADKRAYLAANAEFRRDNPQLFTVAEMAAANNYATASAAPDAWEDFSYIDTTVDELGTQTGKVLDSVASVGEGVKSGLNLTRWLIPAAVFIGAGILLFNLFAATRAPRAAATPAA